MALPFVQVSPVLTRIPNCPYRGGPEKTLPEPIVAKPPFLYWPNEPRIVDSREHESTVLALLVSQHPDLAVTPKAVLTRTPRRDTRNAGNRTRIDDVRDDLNLSDLFIGYVFFSQWAIESMWSGAVNIRLPLLLLLPLGPTIIGISRGGHTAKQECPQDCES